MVPRFILLLFNLICLNFMDIQLVVKRRKRQQIQTLVPIAKDIKTTERFEIINMKNIISTKLQGENAQLKGTIAKLQHKVLLKQRQILWSNTIEKIMLK